MKKYISFFVLIILSFNCFSQTIDTIAAYRTNGLLKKIFYNRYTLPNTTLRYWNGYGVFGSLNDTVRAALSLAFTTTGTSGAATGTYNNTTGLFSFNIPNYAVGGGGGGMAIASPITSATAGSVLFAGTGGILQQSNSKLFYDSTNVRLGIGTTPASKLHIKGAGGNADALTIETTSATSYSAINFNNSSGALAAQFLQTNPSFSSGIYGGKQTILLSYESGGGVMLGSTDVSGTVKILTNNTVRQEISPAGLIRFSAYGAGTLTTDASGNITAASDERLKTNIKPATYGLTELMKLKPITYSWNAKSGNETKGTYLGFSAQNVKASIPYGTGEMKDGYITLQDRAIMATLVNAVKEQQAQIQELKNEIKILKTKK